MVEPVPGVSRRNPAQGYSEGFFQGELGAHLPLTQGRFELAPGLLNGPRIV
jgi:hypothetical protein